ncbi:hypothetical protein TTRE_0000365001 [Trichuris trichiura]|uniref:Uncharacterized protein n=1 Tax=Trichuris trichiura TaxID=36087 RepID=A0A077Z6X6_TRITR|nr:hypothetical protein TTRE_0000365001 [Trichuris trichiura]
MAPDFDGHLANYLDDHLRLSNGHSISPRKCLGKNWR